MRVVMLFVTRFVWRCLVTADSSGSDAPFLAPITEELSKVRAPAIL